MVFSSITFLFYFLPVFLLAYLIFKSHRNHILLSFSLVFYAWGEPIYIILMLFSIFCNYLCGRLIGSTDSEKGKKAYLIMGIVGNLAMLVFFKYFVFFIQQLESLGHYQFALPSIVRKMPLPLGISFFTFQAMSYIIDVYRKHVSHENSFLNIASYIAMFPQLVAGPIVRYETIAEKLKIRELTYDSFMTGMKIFIIGLSSKIILANQFAVYADEVFSHNPIHLSIATSWIGIVCYTFQIYFDFAGYSTMAIGLGKIMGFDFPQNFNAPYIATSVTEFWKRWHMSLSTWFRDYLYIPLGGNKNGSFKTYRNLMIVFVLCGLWHGAAWNFLVWGVYYGIFLILERFFRRKKIGIFTPLRHLYLVLVVMVGWVLFRSPDLSYAIKYLQIMFGACPSNNYYTAQMFPLQTVCGLIAVGAVASVCKWEHFSRFFENVNNNSFVFTSLRYSMYLLFALLCTILLVVSQHNPFIYFRF